MISFAVRRCTFHERRYNKAAVLLHYETDHFFQHRKIFQRFLYQFLQKKTFRQCFSRVVHALFQRRALLQKSNLQ